MKKTPSKTGKRIPILLGMASIIIIIAIVVKSQSGKHTVSLIETANQSESTKNKNEWTEIIDKTFETGQKVAETIEENKKERRANQEKVWAYQFGGPKSEKAVMEAYKKLGMIQDMRIFQVDKNNFLLVRRCDETDDKAEEDSLKLEIAKINGISDRTIKKINLSLKCTSRQELKEDRKPIVKKGPDVNCFVCE